MRHMVAGDNIALVTTRSVEIGRGFEHAFCTRGLIQHHTVSIKEVNYLIPLYLYPNPDGLQFSDQNERRCNYSPAFLKQLAERLRLSQTASGLPEGISPEEIFFYTYAVLHSPDYRRRYAEFLRIDFPRLPLTSNVKLFRSLAEFGEELGALHLLESPTLEKLLTDYSGPKNPDVEKVSYARKTVWLDKAQTTGFKGLPDAAWNFHIGGYQVCEKWLKDRKGRKLSKTDIEQQSHDTHCDQRDQHCGENLFLLLWSQHGDLLLRPR
jgi:predicted helicase